MFIHNEIVFFFFLNDLPDAFNPSQTAIMCLKCACIVNWCLPMNKIADKVPRSISCLQRFILKAQQMTIQFIVLTKGNFQSTKQVRLEDFERVIFFWILSLVEENFC
jgi:hypothetical protein